MGWTKRQFVEHAFEEIGYASYVYDLEPEQLESAMRRLDGMMATWNGKGIRIGYPIPSSPENSDLDEETGVPDSANETIYSSLAVRLAPTVGKIASIETKIVAKKGYNTLLSRATKPVERQLPNTMPAGAGNKGRSIDRPFLDTPDDPLQVGGDSEVEFT